MPRNTKTARATPLATLPMVAPGFRGLNTEMADAAGFVDTDWASVLSNAVFDDLGRISLREGHVVQTTVPIVGTPTILALHEFVRNDETTTVVCVGADYKIYASTDDTATWSDISGEFTANLLATAQVQFANFDNNLYATAPGFKVYKYTGTGAFVEIASSNATSGILLSAFGRLWAARDAADIIDYSGLLDGDDWTGTAAGSVEASNAWTNGADTIKSVNAFGASLIVFGTQHILIYVDGAGSELGIDPNNLYVVDTIEGTGTIHPQSVVPIGEGDLWYMSPQGVQSLARVIQDKVNPLVDISKNVKSLLQREVATHVGSEGRIQALFSPENRYCLFLFPESGRIVAFDTRVQLEDGTYRVTTWDNLDYFSLLRRRNTDVVYGLAGGEASKQTGYRDDSVVYDMAYASPWLNFGEDAHATLKVLKGFYAYLYGRETLTGTARWSFDFRPLEFSQPFTSDYTASGGEWGSGEWGEDEFGSGLRMRKQHIAGMGAGQFVKFYMSLQSTDVDAKVSIQEIGIRAKLGRRT